MPFEDVHDLPPETVELLRKIVGRTGVESAGVDDVVLGAFVCGISTPDQEESTLATLVRSRDMRDRLKGMELELDRFRQTPYGQTGSGNFQPIIAHCMRGALQAAMRVYCRARTICTEKTWAELSTARDLEAKSIRSLIGSICLSIEHAKGHSLRDGRLGGGAGLEPCFEPGTRLRLNPEIRSDGSLSVLGSFEGKLPDPAMFQGRGLSLELVDPNGGSLMLANGIKSPIWSVVLDGFGEISGFPVGTLNPAIFLVGQGSKSGSRKEGHNLYADLENSARSIRFRLSTDPIIEKEQLKLTFHAPETTWSAMDGFVMELMVPVGNVMQLIGVHPLSNLEGEEQTFTCDLPGVVNGEIECGSVIRAHVRHES